MPFIQISDEAHKRKLGVPPPNALLRVFFQTAAARDLARVALAALALEMTDAVTAAETAIAEVSTWMGPHP